MIEIIIALWIICSFISYGAVISDSKPCRPSVIILVTLFGPIALGSILQTILEKIDK